MSAKPCRREVSALYDGVGLGLQRSTPVFDPGTPASNGEEVTTWADQAPLQGNQVLQNNSPASLKTNAINGLPSLQFDGINDSMLANGTSGHTTDPWVGIGPTLSITTVVKNNSPSTTGYLTSFRYNTSDSAGGTNEYITTYWQNGNRITEVVDGNGDRQQIVNNGLGDDEFMVLTVVWDGLAGTLHEYVNGELTGSLTGLAQIAPNSRFLNRIRIGRNDTSSAGTYFDGELAEMLIYTGVLSDGDRISNDAYLVSKYAIPEPASLALMGTGVLLLLGRRRR